MKHAISILESELFKAEKSVELFAKERPNPAFLDYFNELAADYREALKILNDKRSVSVGEKSFHCVKDYCAYDNICNSQGYCAKNGE